MWCEVNPGYNDKSKYSASDKIVKRFIFTTVSYGNDVTYYTSET